MKKAVVAPLLLACLFFLACQRDRNVHAGNDAIQPPLASNSNGEYSGELLRVDVPRKTISIRVENGMEQTFRVDEKTAVGGLPDETAVGNLPGKEGSEVSIKWKDNGGPKLATNVEVTQIVKWKKNRQAGRARRTRS